MFATTDARARIRDKVREAVVSGVVPPGLTLEEIIACLRESKGHNIFEMFGFLSRTHKRNGVVIADGIVSCMLVTQGFAQYLIDSLQDSTTYPMDAFKYHALGTGTTAEANTQSTLVTEVESRVVGTQIEGATAFIYKTVATFVFTGSHAISEHGIFSASSGGIMMDRSILSPVDNVLNTDEIEYTYQLTAAAES